MATFHNGLIRRRVHIQGAVQGVGFRPFVFRLATELGLCGWVSNTSQGVRIEVEGSEAATTEFLERVADEKPRLARVYSCESWVLDPAGYDEFEIVVSDEQGDKTVLVLPDIATCADCLREIVDPSDRRHRYPFTNCTHCGPRYSIVETLPYDRPNTSMKAFPMCKACQAEYDDPLDRRFHAQPTACPDCGPHLALWDSESNLIADRDNALMLACQAIREGKIVAAKGIGGFHLIVDARNEHAVTRLRERKHREHKPLAVMVRDIAAARMICDVSELERRALLSPECPIVLMRSSPNELAPSVAPNNPNLGVMLPATPLHHLMLGELGFPVVATSGNTSDEPIAIDNNEAVARLKDVADLFLVNDRPILRQVDDSVVRIMGGREVVLRRGRGYAPLPVASNPRDAGYVAVGAHFKSAVAVVVGNHLLLSQHIGDLETLEAARAFDRVLADLCKIYGLTPTLAVRDLHPDYLSSQRADAIGVPTESVQHHLAHVAACMAENDLEPPVLGVSWDGTGLGLDHAIWGGEFLSVRTGGWRRVAHLRSFQLPGGDRAARDPCRSAAGLLFELERGLDLDSPEILLMRDAASRLQSCFRPGEWATMQQALLHRVNTAFTSSAGRLFDAVAALTGLSLTSRFEGESAMCVEFCCSETDGQPGYPMAIVEGDTVVLDWAPLIIALLSDVESKTCSSVIAKRFHVGLAQGIAQTCAALRADRVVLTGGCFQNKVLLEASLTALRSMGIKPYWHQRVPPNDGGIALGQLAWVTRYAP